jgi:TetR/AcrR family transcriptional regulator, transcriptional repressor for nem operon
MRKSRSETAESRARIVSNASRLFLTEGISSVGTREIMYASGIAQGGFYRHFNSKEQLLEEAYHEVLANLFAMFEERTAGMSPRDALKKIINLYLSQSPAGSDADLCPLAMLGSELKRTSEDVRSVALLGYERFVRLLEIHLTKMDKPHPRALATAISSTLVGAVTLASIASHEATAKQILKNAREYVLRDIG